MSGAAATLWLFRAAMWLVLSGGAAEGARFQGLHRMQTSSTGLRHREGAGEAMLGVCIACCEPVCLAVRC